MKETKRLVLSRERLRNLTPEGLGRVVGGEPGDDSLNALCNSFDCNLINGTNAFTNNFTNTLTNTLTNNTVVNTLVNFTTNQSCP